MKIVPEKRTFCGMLLLVSASSALIAVPRHSSSLSASSASKIWSSSRNVPQYTNLYLTALPLTAGDCPEERKNVLQERKRQWMNRSMQYYTTVMREEQRRSQQQTHALTIDNMEQLAAKHYFALCKIKSGELRHAELIYRKIIHELLQKEGDCATLAVSTLLLALLKQRMGDIKGTRSVFLNFFRTVIANDTTMECCVCSAKVVQAYALFEMKRGNARKSLQIVMRAVRMDQRLAPVLEWKLFRDTLIRVQQQGKINDHNEVYLTESVVIS